MTTEQKNSEFGRKFKFSEKVQREIDVWEIKFRVSLEEKAEVFSLSVVGLTFIVQRSTLSLDQFLL